MTGLAFLGALLALPLLGLPASGRLCPDLDPWARVGVAGALGALLVCGGMFLLTCAGIPWSIPLLVVPALLPLILPRRGAPARLPFPAVEPRAAAAVVAIGAALALVLYAVVTSRTSAPDLLLFWGAKGIHFARARAIDATFLGDPIHQLMHPDYPPMLPSLYAWATLVAGRFAWGAAMLTMPLFLGLTLATFYGFARRSIGRRPAAEHAALAAALLGFVMVRALTAGNADPLLIFFEVLALSAVTFAGRTAGGLAAAAVGLTGAVLTKVEGVVFASLLVAAFVAFEARGRRLRSAIVLGLPPALALGSWVAFCRFHGLLDAYRPGKHAMPTAAHLTAILRQLLEEASYGALFAPWIALLVLLLWKSKVRVPPIPLVCVAGFLAFLAYIYTTMSEDPLLWIRWSGGRLLMTPLVCLAVAAAARSAPAEAPGSG